MVKSWQGLPSNKKARHADQDLMAGVGKYNVKKFYVKLQPSVGLRHPELSKRILNFNFPECRFSRAARFLMHLVVRARQRRCTRI
jgi:hypothetical protein